jgi:hypothetical protein
MRFSAKYAAGLAALAVLVLVGCGTAAATASAPRTSNPASQSVPTGDLQASQTIRAQGLTVTWNMPASTMTGTQITGAALSNTQAGPDMYVLEMTTPDAASSLASTMQASAGPFTDAQGNDVGSVSIQTDGSEVTASTDSPAAMTAFLNALKLQH